MWTRISNVLKRNDGEAPSAPPQEPAHPSILSQPKPSSAPTATLSPPGSLSKNGKRGLFRRASRIYQDNKESGPTLSLAKRVKSSLDINTNMNDSNFSLTSPTNSEFAPQPAFSSIRSIFKDKKPSAMQMHAAMNKSDDTLNKQPTEALRLSSPSPMPMQPPATPLDAQRQCGSVRSILRDKNTPSSGQNVRFFSRDAYRVISPDASVNNSSGDAPDPSFMQRIREASSDRSSLSPNSDSTKFHSANASPNMFSPLPSFPSGMFFDGTPEASSTPFVTPSQGSTRQSISSMRMPAPPPQLSGIFDFSAAHEHVVHSIPEGEESGLQDGALEVDEFCQAVRGSSEGLAPAIMNPDAGGNGNRVSSHSTISSMSIETPNSINDGSETSIRRRSDEMVFHSLPDEGEKHEKNSLSMPPRASSSLGLHKVFGRESVSPAEGRSLDFPLSASVSSRARALSERVFSRPFFDEMKGQDKAQDLPEADINDNSVTDIVISGPDPFRADASNYYNPDAGFSPPRLVHTRSDSSASGTSAKSAAGASHRSSKSQSSLRIMHNANTEEDEVVFALRTQLAFQKELSSQYELDLSARNEHVKLLDQKVKSYEEDAEKRTKIMRGMRRKVQELERAYRGLEEQIDQSRRESFERSIMDEASGEALRHLHCQLNDHEKRDREARDENERLKEEMRKRDEVIEEVRKQMEAMHSADQNMEKSMEGVRRLVVKGEQDVEQEAERHRAAELSWAEERGRLVGELEQLKAKESEVDVLKREVEAQWSNTEKLNSRAEDLQKEKDNMERETEHLKNELTNLEERMSEMEVEWTESENRRADVEAELVEVWEARDAIEKERDQLYGDVQHERAQLEEVRLALESLESQTVVLKEERQFAIDNATRLEQAVQRRDAELSTYTQKLSAKEQEIDNLHDELSSLRREHSRLQSNQAHALSDVDAREADIQRQLEESVRAQIEAQGEARGLKESVDTLQNEVEKLRRQVHVLQQQSADQDVKILQMERQHEQDNEDKLGLNIALDSKQQELEMLKRKMGVRGTGGATPAAPTRVAARRESASFKTPIAMRSLSSLSDNGRRPLSSLSDNIGRSGKMLNEPSSTVSKTTYGKNSRVSMSAVVKKNQLSDGSITTTLNRKPRSSVPSIVSEKAAPARISSARPASTINTTQHRRVGSSASLSSKAVLMKSGSMSDTSSVLSDKENDATPRARSAARRMPMQLVPA